jgi:hypothetical protein
LDLLKHQYFAQTVEKHGAVSVNPHSFGHFLAVLHQRTFNVPTVTIPKVLHLDADRVVDSYALHTDAHEDDHKSYLTAQLYTPNENVVWTPALNRLDVHKQTLLFANQAPSLINSHVRVATHDRINEALVPNVPVLNKDTTKAVLVNTFHYTNYWEYEFLPVGRKQFQAPTRPVDVEALEVIGTFPVYEHQAFYAVALPTESDGEDKHVVFVLPKQSLNHFLTSEAVEYVFKLNPTKWVKKTIRVQVPRVNITLAHNIEEYIATENIVCSKDNAEQVQPIVQVTNFLIDHEEVSYAVVTGAQISTVKPGRNTAPRSQRGNTFPTQYKFEKMTSGKENWLTIPELIFNKPFFTYFYDTTYGPFGYTAISHVFNNQQQTVQSRHQDNPFDFSDATKHDRFTCDGQH